MKTINLSFLSRRKLARMTASEYGMGYVEDKECKVPFATAKAITVPPYRYDFTKDEEASWWCSFLHECYHHTCPEDFEFLKKKKLKKQNLLTGMNNLVCDHKIEKKNYGMFPGRDRWMDLGCTIALNNIFDRYRTPECTGTAAKIGASFAYDLLARKTWNRSMHSVDAEGRMTDEVREYYDRLLSDDTLLGDYIDADTPELVYDVAKRIVNLLEDDEDAADKQEAESQEGEGEGEGKGKPCEGEAGEGEGEGEGEPVDGEFERAKAVFEEMNFDPDHGPRQSWTSLSIEYPEGSYYDGPYEVREPQIVEMGTQKATDTFCHGRSWGRSYSETIRSKTDGSALSNRVRRYLLSLKQGRYEGGRRSGKLHRKNAWRSTVFAGSEKAQLIHRRKVVKYDLDAAVSVLIDQSGSMGGDRYTHAGASAVLLNNVFARIGIPTEILAFTDTTVPLNIIHKSFNTKVSDDKLVDYLDEASQIMSGNSDGESILWAAERLAKRKEKKKILIVLSDGEPAGSGGINIDGFTKEVVGNLEKRIEVHGIGIQSNTVERYYRSNTVINRADQLEEALISVIKNKVLAQ